VLDFLSGGECMTFRRNPGLVHCSDACSRLDLEVAWCGDSCEFWAIVEPVEASPRIEQTYVDVDRDIALLAYTGGTTGLPKGVGWSPRSIVLSFMSQSGVDQDEIGEEDTVLIPTNLFHANAQTMVGPH
jgi:non-ribosomal peptide synthetase component F